MKPRHMPVRRFFRCLWVACALVVCLAPCGSAQNVAPRVVRRVAPLLKRDTALEAAIRREADADRFSYAYNLVNLHGGAATQALVYLPGPDYCGSGGCTSLLFEKHGAEYRLVTRFTLTRAPILVSSHRTNGWNDLIVSVSGGGIKSSYYAVLRFDGKRYPDNPTVSPAAPLRTSVDGVAYLVGAEKPESDIVVSPR